jgi:hypothetical protein
MKQSMAKTIAKLHISTVAPKHLEDGEDSSCPLTAPAIDFCFAVIRAALRKHVTDHDAQGRANDPVSGHDRTD